MTLSQTISGLNTSLNYLLDFWVSGESNTGAFTGSTTMPGVVKIDTVLPVLTATRLTAANTNGWNNTNVNVEFTCTDSTSGVPSIAAAGATTGNSATSPLDVTVTSEGSAQSVNGSCKDGAGNSATPASITNINIDKTKHVITDNRAPEANANGWNNTNVTVTFTCTETGAVQSGLPAPVIAAASDRRPSRGRPRACSRRRFLPRAGRTATPLAARVPDRRTSS